MKVTSHFFHCQCFSGVSICSLQLRPLNTSTEKWPHSVWAVNVIWHPEKPSLRLRKSISLKYLERETSIPKLRHVSFCWTGSYLVGKSFSCFICASGSWRPLWVPLSKQRLLFLFTWAETDLWDSSPGRLHHLLKSLRPLQLSNFISTEACTSAFLLVPLSRPGVLFSFHLWELHNPFWYIQYKCS